MINAWELLLKARVIQENAGKISVLYEKQAKSKQDGGVSKIKAIKRTPSGLPYTIGLGKACNIVAGYSENSLDINCKLNIEALTEIRDSATHFVIDDAMLTRKLVEISLASVKNYVIASQQWFGLGFSDLNMAVVPLSFNLDQSNVHSITKKSGPAVAKFLAHIQALEQAAPKTHSDFAVSVTVEFDLVKKKIAGAVTAVMVGPNDNPDITLALGGDQVPAAYAWDYKTLCQKLKDRYANFKQNSKYHILRQALEKNPKFCFERFLDPSTKIGPPKRYYNPNIIRQFDLRYTV